MMDFRKRSLPSLEFLELKLHDNHRHQNPFFCIHLNGTNQINILVSNGQMWIIMMKMTFCTHYYSELLNSTLKSTQLTHTALQML